MSKYRVNFTEKIYYTVSVEADSAEEAGEKAIAAFDNGDESVECTDMLFDYFETYEEEVAMTPKRLEAFIEDAMSLDVGDFVRYEVDGTHYIISVFLDDDGFNCELLYSPNEVDDLKQYLFVSKDRKNEVPAVIQCLLKFI